VLSEAECEPIRKQLHDNSKAGGDQRQVMFSGPVSELLDHPVVVDVLREIIARDRGPESYGFRCDSSFYMGRTLNSKPPTPPHSGNMDFWPMPFYRCDNGRQFCWSVRVVWELNPVKYRQGGTLFLSGSHKSNFKVPESYKDVSHPAYDTYACPAGSVVFFCESLCHSSAAWTNAENDRLCILSHYLHLMCKLHEGAPPIELVKQMPKARQSLFRGVWSGVHQRNLEYSEENRAI
jgi:hypothetical protein